MYVRLDLLQSYQHLLHLARSLRNCKSYNWDWGELSRRSFVICSFWIFLIIMRDFALSAPPATVISIVQRNRPLVALVFQNNLKGRFDWFWSYRLTFPAAPSAWPSSPPDSIVKLKFRARVRAEDLSSVWPEPDPLSSPTLRWRTFDPITTHPNTLVLIPVSFHPPDCPHRLHSDLPVALPDTNVSLQFIRRHIYLLLYFFR